MNERSKAKVLDRALSGKRPGPEVAPLAEVARRLDELIDVEPPAAARERALFAQGAALRRRRFSPTRVVMPSLAVVGAIALLALVSRSALPGQTLYPVREALDTVGLVNLPIKEFDEHVGDARALLDKAADLLADDRPAAAQRLAYRAVLELGAASSLLDELEPDDEAVGERRIGGLLGEAQVLIDSASRLKEERAQTVDGDDNSGPSSDDSGEDDNSGPGSDDSGEDDNSGPGSDDSGEDDNSGPGSDDSGEDDNSGPRGGDEGSDDSGELDSSGPSESSGSGSGETSLTSDDDGGESRSGDSD